MTGKNAAGSQLIKRTYNYTASSVQREQVQSMATYTTGGSPVNTTSYTYGPIGQLTRAKTIIGTSGTNIRDDVFTYDAAGNRLTRVRTDNASAPVTQTFAYNVANQLCWRYNAAVASPSCGTVPSGATTFSYDAAGNQLTDTNTTWDAQGRLKTLAGSAATILSPDSNNEITALGTSTYHNNDLGVSRITVGGALSQIVRNPMDGSAISQIAAGAKRWFITDNIGSTIGLADTQGTIARGYNYDTDGNDTTTGTGPETWLRFAGGQLMGTTGLIHFGERYYQPTTGRWTQQDPLLQPGDLGQANRYSYVGGDPVNSIDATGLFSIQNHWWGSQLRLTHGEVVHINKLFGLGAAAGGGLAAFLGRKAAGMFGALLGIGAAGLNVCDWRDNGVVITKLKNARVGWCWAR